MRLLSMVVVVTGIACSSPPVVDAGVNEADASVDFPDASAREDAGLQDSGGPASLFFTADELAVHLAWDAGDTSEDWLVVRDDVVVARLSAPARSFHDLGATSGRLGGFDASVTIDLPEGIELEWSAPDGEPGTPHVYSVRTESGPSSNTVTAARGAPSLVGFTLERGDAGWSFDAGESSWLDTTAPFPSFAVASLSATARPNDQTTSVVLEASVDAGRVLLPVQYRLIARATGNQSYELHLSGARGGPRIEYQWQRSTADAPTGFVDLPYVHGLTWLDPEAVLSEGRYYRVAARAPGQEWLSSPVRAELRAPVRMVSSENGRNAFILRDDGVSLSLRYPRPPVQFPPLLDFFSFRHLACGLLNDAGIECEDEAGGLAPLNLPPVQSVRATQETLWVELLDGGVDGYQPSGSTNQLQFRTRVNLLDASRLVAGSDISVCGSRADGGVRCVFAGMSTPSFEGSTGFGSWMTRYGTFTVSDPQGNTTQYHRNNATSGPLPAEDAGYVSGSYNFHECGVRSDGLVRCVRTEVRSIEPPVSAERYVFMDTAPVGRCGLTMDGRVRCMGLELPHVPPAPPVKDIQVQDQELVALLENGLTDSRGPGISVRLRESADDRFVALSRDWRSRPASIPVQCGLRADGVALCGGSILVTVPAASRYSQITSHAGLLFDGGVESFVTRGPSWPGVPVVELKEHPEPSITCARFADGGWSCSPQAVLPAQQLTSLSLASTTRGCGLTARGRLECWPDPPPASMAGRRFRHVHMTPSNLCGTALDGEVLCVSASGVVLPPLRWDDFVFFEQSSNQGCGIRRDRTVACRADPLWGRPPWAP